MSKERLTSLQIGNFLQDFEKYATFEIIEGAKEKNEIIKIAKAKGIDLKRNKDLLGFKCIYAFADRPNSNLDYLPEKALLKALPSIIGKPVNISHDRRYVVGHILDYRYQQKEKRVMAFGVVYSSCFEDEARMLKTDFADKKLTVSFEIFSPPKKRKKRADGVTELYDMTMAGMALLPRDTDPSFVGANVLALARKKMDSEKDLDLVFASKYQKGDIIIADHFKDEVEKSLEKLKKEENANQKPEEKKTETIKKEEIKKETPKEEITEPEIKETPKEPEVIVTPKVKCSNCTEELDLTIIPEISHGLIKCSKCFAILIGHTGEMKYPPQIKNFKMTCPSSTCRMNNWLILENTENKTKLKCLNETCNKKYEIEFATENPNELLDKMKFLYINKVPCLQCGKYINISTTSSIKNIDLTCIRCGLKFPYDIIKTNRDRQVFRITEIIKDESSEKEREEEVKKEEKPEEKKTETIKKEEIKKETPKPTEKLEVTEPKKEAPKEEVTEKQVEKVKVPKVEEPEAKASLENPAKSSEEVKEPKSLVDVIKEENKVKKAETVEEKVTEAKKPSVIRKAVKKILILKKEIKTTKFEKTKKEDILKIAIKKVVSQLIKANAEIKKIKLETDQKITLYKYNAQEILKRREKLGKDYGEDLSDKDILDNDKFEVASLRQENTLLKASKEESDDIVGDKNESEGNDEITKQSKIITAKAFPKKPKKGSKNE